MAARFYICFYHDKRTFRSSNQAYQEAKRMNERKDQEEDVFRVFFCQETGGYHHTSISQVEMDRRRRVKEGGKGKHSHENFEAQKRRARQSPRISLRKQRGQ